MNIVILDAYSVNPGDIDWTPIGRFGTLTAYDHTPPEQIANRLQNADTVFTNRVRLGEKEFSTAPKLRFSASLQRDMTRSIWKRQGGAVSPCATYRGIPRKRLRSTPSR